jgi:hypothetical protein
MEVNRKIAKVVTQVKMDDEDMLDVAFWLTQSPMSRLAEVVRLRKKYFSRAGDVFPEKMEKVARQRKM